MYSTFYLHNREIYSCYNVAHDISEPRDIMMQKSQQCRHSIDINTFTILFLINEIPVYSFKATYIQQSNAVHH